MVRSTLLFREIVKMGAIKDQMMHSCWYIKKRSPARVYSGYFGIAKNVYAFLAFDVIMLTCAINPQGLKDVFRGSRGVFSAGASPASSCMWR